MRAWRVSSRCLFRNDVAARRSYASSRAPRTQTSIADLFDGQGDKERIEVNGWVRSVRKQKRIAFAAIGDGSTTTPLQAVFLKPDQATGLSYGTSVRLTGSWESSQGSGQSHELKVTDVQLLGENDPEDNPLQPKYQTAEYLRTIPHLRSRTAPSALLLRLRSQVIASLTRFFDQEGFIQTHPPIITSSDCEGAGEVFTVSSNASKKSDQQLDPEADHFFRKEKYLTVSGQLHLESLAQAVNKVWALSPTFRAEKSDTPRHLAEFYMLEAELCFIDDMADLMDLVERMLRAVATDLLSARLGSELLQLKASTARDAIDEEGPEHVVDSGVLRARWEGMISNHWPRITYDDAITRLRQAVNDGQADFVFPPSYEDGLHAEHERYLAETVGKGKPVFVTDYPAAQKPFYMPPSTSTANSNGRSDTVACFDLLVPQLCELVGGSMREHRLKDLLAVMQAKNVDQGKDGAGGSLEWYKDLRRYGSVPHGGFGLGFDRLLCYLSGTNSIRDVVTFPRWFGRCDC